MLFGGKYTFIYSNRVVLLLLIFIVMLRKIRSFIKIPFDNG